jgi:general secretion pathway protein C
MTALLNSVRNNAVLPLRWVLIGLIAYTLATTGLFLVSGPTSEPAAGTLPQSQVPGNQQKVNLNDILEAHLFGKADAGERPAAAAPTSETRLPLVLNGVFVAEIPGDSAAIVAQKGRSGLLFGIGDSLPGNATLVEVHADHVVLRRAGTRETLTFPEVSGIYTTTNLDLAIEPANRSADAQIPNPEAAATAPSAREFVERYRDQLQSDPQSALTDLGIAAVSADGAQGYRLGNLAQSPYLSQTGLQSGDVILSVNGRPVGDLSQDRLELDNVLAQGSARLEVQRGSRRFFVTASLK